MSEQTGGRCQWEGCEEAATKRAERMEHVDTFQRDGQGVTIHNQIHSWELCDRHTEEIKARDGITETPLDGGF